MPFVFLILGVLLLVVAVRGTQSNLFNLLKTEFTGDNNFFVWASAFVILGFLAYFKTIRPVAQAFALLLFLVLVLTNKGGFFAKFNQGIRNPTVANPPAPSTPNPTPGQVGLPFAPPVTQPGDPGHGTDIPNFGGWAAGFGGT